MWANTSLIVPPGRRRAVWAGADPNSPGRGAGHSTRRLSPSATPCARPGLTPSWAFASLSTPSGRSATASIPYFWGFQFLGYGRGLGRRQAGRARAEIVRLVHRTTGVRRLAQDVTRILERAVPLDGVGLLTVDPATLLPTGLVVRRGLHLDLLPRFIEIELGEPDFIKFCALARQGVPPPGFTTRLEVISTRASAIASSSDRKDSTTNFASCSPTPPGPGAPFACCVNPGCPASETRKVRFLASLARLVAEGLRRACHTQRVSHSLHKCRLVQPKVRIGSESKAFVRRASITSGVIDPPGRRTPRSAAAPVRYRSNRPSQPHAGKAPRR